MAGLNQAELTDVLNLPPFGARVVEVSEHTADTGLEAGFALYRGRSGVVAFSDVHHPDVDYLEAMAEYDQNLQGLPPEERLNRLLRLMDPDADPDGSLPQLDLGRLILNEDATSIRTDLAIVAHGHPLLHLGQRDVRSFLLPSAADIRNFAEHAAANAQIIEGVTATHKDLGGAALLLWRAKDERAIQNIEGARLGAVVPEDRLAALGLGTATVIFNRRTGRVVKRSLASLANLYS